MPSAVCDGDLYFCAAGHSGDKLQPVVSFNNVPALHVGASDPGIDLNIHISEWRHQDIHHHTRLSGLGT